MRAYSGSIGSFTLTIISARREDVVGRRDELAAGVLVLLVLDPRPDSGALLDEHFVPRLRERGDPGRHQADAVFVVLDLLRKADDHGALLVLQLLSICARWSLPEKST